MDKDKEMKYYTTHQAAKELGVKPATIDKWVNAKHIKAIRTLGGHRRIPLSEFVRIKSKMGFDESNTDELNE